MHAHAGSSESEYEAAMRELRRRDDEAMEAKEKEEQDQVRVESTDGECALMMSLLLFHLRGSIECTCYATRLHPWSQSTSQHPETEGFLRSALFLDSPSHLQLRQLMKQEYDTHARQYAHINEGHGLAITKALEKSDISVRTIFGWDDSKRAAAGPGGSGGGGGAAGGSTAAGADAALQARSPGLARTAARARARDAGAGREGGWAKGSKAKAAKASPTVRSAPTKN